MNRRFILLPLMLVVLTSGCTIPGLPGAGPALFGPGVSGSGVVIEYFEPDFKDAISGQDVQFEYRIRNTGTQPAEGCSAEILDLDRTTWGGIPSKCATTFDLQPASPVFGSEGESHICIAKGVKAPQLPAGTSFTYEPVLRVLYKYKSVTQKTVSLLPLDDARRLQNQGKTFSAATSSKTQSPIDIGIAVKEPIRVFASQTEFPVEIHVANVGGGQSRITKTDNWGKAKVTIKTEGPIQLSSECRDKEITFYRGSTVYTCAATVDNNRVTAPTTGIITATAEYDYAIDKATSITVAGT